ncbi:hypothetical protein [uncultured Mediterranean phage]|jgi:hypothetical protein|nr:hypothetical protein [uncultured Mediterranean phage]
MNSEHEEHLNNIQTWFSKAIDSKYRAGQAEHGGEMWMKPGMLRCAIEEALDQVTYLKTMHDQIKADNPELLEFLMGESE